MDPEAAALLGADRSFLETMQARFEENPGSVNERWQAFFRSLDASREAESDKPSPVALEVEVGHIACRQRRAWARKTFERLAAEGTTDGDVERITVCLVRAATFERFLERRFTTAKTFGLGGAETLVVLLEELLARAAGSGIGEIVVGGMHRGRLNTLYSVFGKAAAAIFRDLLGLNEDGDAVPFHRGFEGVRTLRNRDVTIHVLPHPSHLMAVAPVAAGYTRARQDIVGEGRQSPLCLLLHTDAAVAGQGVTAELLQLGALPFYRLGGTIHIVVNNRIGFTTDPAEARSSRHPTDIAKAVEAPVIRVDGDDPEAVLKAARWAVAWRHHTAGDVFVDLVCYRRRGHNETDEPRITHPLLYRAIDRQVPVSQQWTASRRQLATPLETRTWDELDADHQAAVKAKGRARPASGFESLPDVDTGLAKEHLDALVMAITTLPDSFTADRRVQRTVAARRAAVLERGTLDWGGAEALALASALAAGTSVRFSGQDSARGTFSHRHARIVDQETGLTVTPLANAAAGAATLAIANTPLSEYAVLAFEYGYSLAAGDCLVIWEAQFGDFINVAQVVLDLFIAAGEERWGLTSGLVLLLPHGLEGQGPDHSSARPERLLQLCAGHNMTVANPTTAANFFHLMRRHLLTRRPRPLIVLTPKSMLRSRQAASAHAEFLSGTRFREVMADRRSGGERHAILCSGKIAHEIEAARSGEDVALVRLEQLYPFPAAALRAAIEGIGHLVWCQEEPANQGAWPWVRERLRDVAGANVGIGYAGRPPQAAASQGTSSDHLATNAAIVTRALRRQQ